MSNQSQGNWLINKLLLPLLLAVLTSIMVTAFTPAGDWLRKILFTPPISLEFQSQVLGFDAPSEAFEFPQATYKITVWIEGEEKTLSQVRKVTYSLPSPTHLQEFVQDSPKDGFRYSYTGKAQMVFGATSSSEQIKAKVELNNGQVMSLSRGADKDEGQSK